MFPIQPIPKTPLQTSNCAILLELSPHTNRLESLFGKIGLAGTEVKFGAESAIVVLPPKADALTVIESIVEHTGIQPIITPDILHGTWSVGLSVDPGDRIFNLMDGLLEQQLSAIASEGQSQAIKVSLG